MSENNMKDEMYQMTLKQIEEVNRIETQAALTI